MTRILLLRPSTKPSETLFFRLAVGGDAIPMPIDHLGKLFIRCEPLPLQARAPVLEEAPSPALALVVPKLAEGFLQNVGRVQPLVRRQQQRERSPALQAKVLVACEQRVFLSLDETPT